MKQLKTEKYEGAFSPYEYPPKVVGSYKLGADSKYYGILVSAARKPGWFKRKMLLWCLNIGWEDSE